MQNWRIVLGLVLCGFGYGEGHGAGSVESLLPADALGFVSVRSVPAATTTAGRSALGQLWADPAMRLFREDFERSLTNEVLAPLENELGFRFKTWSSLVEGGLTVALTATPADQQPERKTSFVLLADTGSKSAQAMSNLIALRTNWAAAGREFRVHKIHDVELAAVKIHPGEIGRVLSLFLPDPEGSPAALTPTTEAPPRTEWTVGLAGSILVLGDSAKEIEKVLAAQKAAGSRNLFQTEALAAQSGLFSNSLVHGWIHLPTALDRLQQKKGRAPAGAAEGAGAFSLGQVLNELGLGDARSFGFALRQAAEGTSMEARLALPGGKRKGLFQLLDLLPKDSGPPAFVPEGAAQFSRVRLRLPQAWGQLEKLLAGISPPAANFLKFVMDAAGKDKDAAFDLRARLLDRLGDDLMSYDMYLRPAGGRGVARLANIKLVGAPNPEVTAQATTALVSLLPPEIARYREREFLGRTVYSATTPQTLEDGSVVPGTQWHCAPGPFHVAVADDNVLLEDYLRNAQGALRPLTSKPGLEEAARRVGGMSTGLFTYDNKSESMRFFFESANKESLNAMTILKSMKLGAKAGTEGGFLSWFDWALLPPFERVARYFHFSVSAVSQDGQGYAYRWFAPSPPTLKK